jgi:iron complex outermembrane receptor protein
MTHPRHSRLATAAAFLLLAASPPATAQDPSELDALLATRVDAASRLERTTMRAPASVTLITADDIARFGYRDLAEALASAVGLHVSYDRNYSYIGVRGISRPSDYNNRVAIMIDGIRLNEDVYGYAAIGGDLPIDMGAIERIEIVRGPGSAAFGTAAMLAVVNVVLRAPHHLAQGRAAVEAGDFGRFAASARGVLSSGGGAGLAWSAMATQSRGQELSYSEYADEPGGGRTADTDWERARGVTLRGSFAEIELTGFATRRDKGIPTGSFETVFDDRRNATSDAWTVLAAKWSRTLRPGLEARVRAEAGRYDYDGAYVYDVLTRDSTDNDWWRGEVQGTWAPRADQRLAAGLEYRDNRRANYRAFDDVGNVDFAGDFPFRIFAAYAEYEIQLTESLLVSAGLRHDDYSLAGSSTNPRAAIVYQPDDRNAFKLLYGSAFRAPNVYELHYENSDAIGNPDLEPEKIQAFEIVWQRRVGDDMLATASLFQNALDHLIEQRPAPGGELLQFANVGRARSRGIELGLTRRAAAGWLASFDAGYQRAVDEETDAELSNAPETVLRFAAASPVGRPFQGSLELIYEAGRRTLQGRSTTAATVVNATFTWSPRPETWALRIQARNLFDTRYEHPGGPEHRQSAIEQDGRALTLRVEVGVP